MKRTTLAAAALMLATCAPAVHAADDDPIPGGTPRIEITPSPTVKIGPLDEPSKRPAALPLLYTTFVGLQAYDAYSTLRGVNSGASETNPLIGGLAQHSSALLAVKTISTVTSIYFAEQLWRQHHRTQAVVMIIVANGAMGAVAARNATILSRR